MFFISVYSCRKYFAVITAICSAFDKSNLACSRKLTEEGLYGKNLPSWGNVCNSHSQALLRHYNIYKKMFFLEQWILNFQSP